MNRYDGIDFNPETSGFTPITWEEAENNVYEIEQRIKDLWSEIQERTNKCSDQCEGIWNFINFTKNDPEVSFKLELVKQLNINLNAIKYCFGYGNYVLAESKKRYLLADNK
ncbi:MAG: hypothetical protein KJ630_14720 [Proteobacteria bacterium]|nr:hypothetical protein [Pseudomonadota bacterium]